MRKKVYSPLRTIAALALTLGSANGAAIIYEPFSQATGDLSGKAGGTGLLGNWTTTNNTIDIVPATLAYGDLPNAGNQVSLPSAAGNWARVSTTTDLADAGLLDDGATLWFSYVFMNTNGGGSNEHSGFAFGTDRVNPAFNGLNLNTAGAAFGVYVRNSSATASSWSGTSRTAGTGVGLQAYGTPTLLIGRIVWGANALANDTLTLFTRALDNIATEPTTGGGVRSAVLDQSLFNTISFGQRNSGGTHTYDEIRFGSTYDDVIGAMAAPSVIPEPSTALLGGIGMLMLFRRRR